MHSTLRIALLSLLSFFALLAFHAANAQTTSAPSEDDVFVQGEYVGNVSVDGRNWNLTGLQVVALGDGKFDGVLYAGGLPGNGWNRETKWKVSGARSDQGVTLGNEQVNVVLKPQGNSTLWRAAVQGVNGNPQGFMIKMNRVSSTMGARPVHGAVVLFDGTQPVHLENATVTDNGLLNVVLSKGGFWTTDPVGDFRLHVEFQTPFEPTKRGQGRGNSGVYIQRRYEVQILDSFGLEGVHNECGGIYTQRRPDINMAFPPLAWQTYDIYFTAARFDDEGKKINSGRITVLHNGVTIHNDYEIVNKTGAGQKEGPDKLPILWQNHSNPVHYRNIWIVHDPVSAVATTAASCHCEPRFGSRLRRNWRSR